MYLAKSPKRSKRREGRPERKKAVSWIRKVKTVASWNSVKLAVRTCARHSIYMHQRERSMMLESEKERTHLPARLEGRRHCR